MCADPIFSEDYNLAKIYVIYLYPFSIPAYPVQCHGAFEPIPACIWLEAGYILDMLPVYLSAQNIYISSHVSSPHMLSPLFTFVESVLLFAMTLPAFALFIPNKQITFYVT